ncbi:MAG: COX15/CtaA family protein [Saprospiraceae bacterium]|nr:COX15/CtaA family protein [Saprospiraceae bacterium]
MLENNNRSYIRYSWFLMGMVFLVILAGGVVRMTQSGMGCPDWPKCFGMWIPPTDASQLPADFEKYLSKQDIDHSFNVFHTWIEYINRLLGALLGVFILGYLVWTVRKFWSTNKKLVGIAFLLLVAVAIQGYLGKVVVDENLSVVKITIHMIGALVIAALPLININWLSPNKFKVDGLIRHGTTIMIIVLLVQIILGTQVREEIDMISKSLAYEQRELWINRLGNIFVIHRSFSWIVLLGCMGLFIKGRSIMGFASHIRNIVLVLISIILLGIIMAYLNMPAIAQPLHLLLASALLMQLFYTRLKME